MYLAQYVAQNRPVVNVSPFLFCSLLIYSLNTLEGVRAGVQLIIITLLHQLLQRPMQVFCPNSIQTCNLKVLLHHVLAINLVITFSP